jgi:hypothetical protein
LYLGRSLYLDSSNEALANAGEYGRVVLISGEASAPDLVAKYSQRLKAETEARKSELDTWFAESLAKMPRAESK